MKFVSCQLFNVVEMIHHSVTALWPTG